MPFPVKDESQVITAANSVASDRITPVFAISNVTGHGLDLLRSFIVKLRRKRVNASELYAPDLSTLPSVLLNIDGVYQVPGVGLVIGGTLIRGSIHTGQNLQVGPDRSGQYQAVTVRSIECKRLPVKEVGTGMIVTNFNIWCYSWYCCTAAGSSGVIDMCTACC
jgi:GTPase